MTESAEAGVGTRVVRDTVGWDALRPDWDALHADSPAASPPLKWEWLRRWWQVYGDHYGAPGGGLRLLTVWRASRLIGVLPLYLGLRGRLLPARRLGFLSSGEAEFEETCPDYMDLLHAPGEADVCLREAAAWLDAPGERWDELVLNDVSADSALLTLPTHLRERTGEATVGPRGICPVADLSGGFEAYLKRLSPKVRQHARQYLRGAERAGLTFEVAAGAEEADAYFDQLVALHQARWTAAGRPGCFAARRFTEFHRGLARAWVPTGEALLARLSAGERPVALLYGFAVRGKFDFYQSGIDLAAVEGVRSPGAAVQLLLMRHLAERGFTTFDFLRGNAQYKTTLSTGERPLASVRVERPNVRRALRRISGLARRVVRAGRAAVPGRAPRQPQPQPQPQPACEP